MKSRGIVDVILLCEVKKFMIKAAVFGYGNIGKAAIEAINAAPDFELAGVVSSSLEKGALGKIPVVRDVDELSDVQIVILCIPSRNVPDIAEKILLKGISTVDCFDIHSETYNLFTRLDAAAKKGNSRCATSIGFDPGIDSAIRALFEAAAPKGLTYTNFGPGMSMGHSVAVRKIPGVKDAMSVTIPVGAGVHRRMVYVVLEDGADFNKVTAQIKSDPYFVNDETHVIQVSNLDMLIDRGHSVSIQRKGVSGSAQNQRFTFEMSIDNPAMTAQMMVSAARAVLRQAPGAYTMLHLPPIDLLYGTEEELIRRLV
ncbi:diaminopimelate dehydrogenase [Thermoclostridium stercorarium]|nr:diaminopimelate dehydrogenase [Thermoclostridium stercorarium]AGI39919.1 diaminopimelate dehydrogenase [Thermoclostridium stercorarium subsp. stercorarium DSM 8532]UZQ84917.1 diaminopimelate dehydrogenase [Thermoclostridium stercorarium]